MAGQILPSFCSCRSFCLVLLQLFLLLNRHVVAVPAPAVTEFAQPSKVPIPLANLIDAKKILSTSTSTKHITSCSCTKKTKSNHHSTTIIYTNAQTCKAQAIKPTCKTITSTIKKVYTLDRPASSPKPVSSPIKAIPAKATTIHSSTKASSTTHSKLASSTSSRASGTPVPNNGRRGLAYNNALLTAPFSLSNASSHVSWTYNWYSAPYTGGNSGYNPVLAYTPMLWSNAADLTNVWLNNVRNCVQQYGTKAVLSFNEPDLCYPGSACMSVDVSVAAWKKWMEPLKGTVRLGAPAVSNGVGPTMGLAYMKQFLQQCSGCTIDFVPVHWYGDAGDTAGFQNFVTQAYAAGGKRPVWVTEFGTTNGTPAQTQAFLKTVMAWMDGGGGGVEKYAWFMDTVGNLIDARGWGLSTLGTMYDSG